MIANNVTRQQFATWFVPVTFCSFDEGERLLTLCMPSPFIREYIEAHFLRLFRAVLQHFFVIMYITFWHFSLADRWELLPGQQLTV
jgi:chromosomal replication initiation ATPase DnaA